MKKIKQKFVSTPLQDQQQESESATLDYNPCNAFMADIPLFKLVNKEIKSFIKNCYYGKFSKKRIPSESCIGKKNRSTFSRRGI